MRTNSIDWRQVGRAAGLLAAYVGTARLGLLMHPVAGVATTVWPPTGIALVAMLLYGRSLWPAVALGALMVNLWAGAPLGASLGIAAGNTLEAVLGTSLLRRTGDFDPSLGRIRDVVRLLVLAALLSTMVSAGLGTLSVLPHTGRRFFFSVWWVGDMMGDLIVAPLLLTWTAGPPWPHRPRQLGEALAVLACLIAVSLWVFWRSVPSPMPRQTYVLFPFLVWAAVRFAQRGAATAIFVVTAIAVLATARSMGPFAQGSVNQSFLLLHTFMGTVGVTILILGAAIAERQQAIGVRDEFLSVASHELSTPITTLRLRLQTLTRRLDRGALSTEDLAAGLHHAHRQIDRVTLLVGNLLDVSRISAGRLTLSAEEVDLAALVREVIGRFHDESLDAGCHIELLLPESLCGSWDRLRLEQVVTNFLTNAIKYGRGSAISVSVCAQGGAAVLTVQDRGPGIAPKDHDRIFERFERVEGDSSVGGLGLGLYIVRQIVQAHGGGVRVESTPGSGATFVVELPLQPEPLRPG